MVNMMAEGEYDNNMRRTWERTEGGETRLRIGGTMSMHVVGTL